MSRRVEALLEAGGRTRYERLLALKYLLLIDHLRETGGAGADAAERLAEGLQPLAEIPVADVVAFATPFFWLNVQRLYNQGPGVVARPELVTEYLLAQSFDSLFGQLPDGSAITVRGDAILPRLGLQVAASDGSVGLRRLGPNTVEVTTGGERKAVELAAPPAALRLPKLPIPGEPGQLLQVGGEQLFEPSFMDKLEPDTPVADKLAGMIGEALIMIRRADPRVADQMRSLIHFYEPLSTPDPLTTHCSFSAPRLIGVIFVSEAYSIMKLAEAMVHEYHHNELYTLMEVEPVLDEKPGESFYSPWRPDPRPMYGLIHAIHVFLGVLQYLRGGETAPGLEEHAAAFRERRRVVCCQVNLGLLQVDENRLTPAGRDIIASIREEFSEHLTDLGGLPKKLPYTQELHLRTWLAENPGLVHRVRLPGDAASGMPNESQRRAAS
jgi:HEXXH motif-containing protein